MDRPLNGSDWREQTASSSQPVMLSVERALVTLCLKQSGSASTRLSSVPCIPHPLPAAAVHVPTHLLYF